MTDVQQNRVKKEVDNVAGSHVDGRGCGKRHTRGGKG